MEYKDPLIRLTSLVSLITSLYETFLIIFTFPNIFSSIQVSLGNSSYLGLPVTCSARYAIIQLWTEVRFTKRNSNVFKKLRKALPLERKATVKIDSRNQKLKFLLKSNFSLKKRLSNSKLQWVKSVLSATWSIKLFSFFPGVLLLIMDRAMMLNFLSLNRGILKAIVKYSYILLLTRLIGTVRSDFLFTSNWITRATQTHLLIG